jgi:hypothetical protein
MSYCEEKHRLIRAHADAVHLYVELHYGGRALTDGYGSSLAADIKTARGAMNAQRKALDTHTCEHGCTTSPW